jgi:hypothetical protein
MNILPSPIVPPSPDFAHLMIVSTVIIHKLIVAGNIQPDFGQ